MSRTIENVEAKQNEGPIVTDMIFSKEHLKIFVPGISEKDISGKKFGTEVMKVIPFSRNFDNDCREDFINGKGIRIQSHESFDKKNQKIYDGLQSPFFGSDYGDELAFSERYTCQCGRLKGQMYEHRYCPECNTEVQYNDIDLDKFGWIIIDGEYYIIQPLYYAKLESLLGKMDQTESVLSAIINVKYRDDNRSSGSNEPILDDKDKLYKDKHPFIRRGMKWLSTHLRYVLDYYQKRRPSSKKDAFAEIYDNIDKVFCHCIPVYSSVLRIETPGEKGEKSYKVKTNTCYRSIVRSVNKINELVRDRDGEEITPEEETTINRFLSQIQKDLQINFEEELKIISGKNGFIQAKVIAGRYNFSARNIIISGNDILHTDEIEVCYSTFIELFRYELINIYAKFKNCTLAEADNAVRRANAHFDKEIYYMMELLIETPQPIYLLCNRNPSINFGSFLALKIVKVKPDMGDKTLTLNRRVLQTMGADFDGDQLNIFRIIGMDLSSRFVKNMDPTLNLFINRIDGRLNTAMTPAKDEAMGFYVFNNIK